MSDQSAQTAPASDLDATVDGLLAGPDAGAASAPAPSAVAASSASAVTAAPAPAPAPQNNGPALAELDNALAEDPMLAQVASDIAASAAVVSTAPAPTAPAPQSGAPSDPATAPNPNAAPPAGTDIDRLDAAIATDADRLLAEAQAEMPPEPVKPAAPAAPAPTPKPVAPAPAPKPAPVAPVAASTQVAPPAPAPAVAHEPVASAPPAHTVEVIVAERPRVAADAPKGPGVLAMLAEPLGTMLRPISDLHERLGESARQTVAYCAILTTFCAACAWGMPRFMRSKELEPVSQGQLLYDDTTPAHGVVAPVRAEPEAAPKAEHAEGGDGHGGGEGEGHGDAKKPSRAKPDRKSSHGGGGDSHSDKRSSSRATKAPAAQAEAHAEH
jgi:hypothetical protein